MAHTVTRAEITRYNALWEVALRLQDCSTILTYGSNAEYPDSPELVRLLKRVEDRLGEIIDAIDDEVVDASRAEGGH